MRHQLRSDAALRPGEDSSSRSAVKPSGLANFFLLSVSDCVGLSEKVLSCSYVHHHHHRLFLRRLSESLV